MTGSIISIQTCPGLRQPMRPLTVADLHAGGIPGDDHFAPESARQLLLIEGETLAAVGLEPGSVKENITVQGVSLMDLQPGARVSLGPAEIEITQECRPCSRMDEIRTGLKDELEGRRGMLARVIRPGRIRPGDPVNVVRSPAPSPEVIG
jgi:MOSC domain-containing protein YiiM